MAFTIELTIRGLCAFVPSEPLSLGGPQPMNGGMKVLVLDARIPDVVSNGAIPPSDLEICAHLPLLRYSHPKPGMPRGFRLLDGHRIEILGIDSGQPLQIMPSFREGALMEKVVALDQPPNQADPTKARVDSSFLTPLPPAGLAATMDLTAGTVETTGSVGFWSFQPPPPPPQENYEDFFRAAVVVKIPILTEEAVLRTITRDGTVDFRQTLRPKGNSQVVDILLSNLCLEDDQPRRPIEGDFAVFYNLLPDYDGILRVPHLQNPGGSGNPGRIHAEANSSPSCAVGIMKSSS